MQGAKEVAPVPALESREKLVSWDEGLKVRLTILSF